MVQSFADDALTTCESCGGALRKVFSGVGVVFKGSGFYRTDSRGGSSSSTSSSTASSSSESAGTSTSTPSSGSTGGNSTSAGTGAGSGTSGAATPSS